MVCRSLRILFGVLLALLCPRLVSAQTGFGLTVNHPTTNVVGSTIHYTIILDNQTGLVLTGIGVTDAFPTSLQFVGAESNRGPVSVSSGKVVFTINQLSVGAQTTLFLDLRPTATGTVANRVSVGTAAQFLGATTAETTIIAAEGRSDLSVSI